MKTIMWLLVSCFNSMVFSNWQKASMPWFPWMHQKGNVFQNSLCQWIKYLQVSKAEFWWYGAQKLSVMWSIRWPTACRTIFKDITLTADHMKHPLTWVWMLMDLRWYEGWVCICHIMTQHVAKELLSQWITLLSSCSLFFSSYSRSDVNPCHM